MQLSHATEMLLVLSMLSGAVHVLAPDHWLPASVLAWKRGWSLRKSAVFAAVILTFHVLLGAAIYFCLEDWLEQIRTPALYGFGVALVFLVMILRLIRFSRIREVLRAGPKSNWGIFAVLSLLGPCESIIPVFIKSGQLRVGYLLPGIAFLFGTLISGWICILLGRTLWDRPLWLPRGVTWAFRRGTLVPVAAGLAVGLGLILAR